ncbi:MAG: metallophosphatase family protein [Lachnospiraceae bacterium]|nr:metallophosphatase family protein [Lachnospiraceae bacterium]
MKIAIISDTHSLLRDEVVEKIRDCDIILHGGDIASKETMEVIKKLGKAYFVRGNADKEWAEDIPYELEIELSGYNFYMVHKKSDIKKDLSGIDFVIYGHSHKYEQRNDCNITYLNPGSCGPRRFTQPVTLMIMVIDEQSRAWEIEKIDLSPILKKGAKLPPPKEMDIIIKSIVKDMNANRAVDKIAQRNRVDKALVEEILQIYTTHPGIDVDGILNRMK